MRSNVQSDNIAGEDVALAFSKRTILVIDDDKEILIMLRAFIEANHGQALLAENTEVGLALTRSHSVDLILLDIVLPDEDGYAALRKIRAVLPKVPVIMMTGFNKMETARKCLEIGARDFIAKPFDLDYLKTTALANILGTP